MAKLKWSFAAFLSFLLFFARGTSCADYLMTETEMTQAQIYLTELETQQKAQVQLLTKQEAQLATLQTQLETARQQTEKSAQALTKAETQLRDYETFLTESKNETEQTQKRIKRQRSTWAIIAGILAGAWLTK